MFSSSHNSPLASYKYDEAATVDQGRLAVTTADSNKPILRTIGANPCVILALYDKKNKKTALAHIDDEDCLDRVLVSIQDFLNQDTVAYIAGGGYNAFNNNSLLITLIDFLQSNKILIANLEVVRSFSQQKIFEGKFPSLAIDARTGTVYSPIREGLGRQNVEYAELMPEDPRHDKDAKNVDGAPIPSSLKIKP